MNQRFKLNSVIFLATFFVFSNYVVSDELSVRMDEYDLVERKHLKGFLLNQTLVRILWNKNYPEIRITSGKKVIFASV